MGERGEKRGIRPCRLHGTSAGISVGMESGNLRIRCRDWLCAVFKNIYFVFDSQKVAIASRFSYLCFRHRLVLL